MIDEEVVALDYGIERILQDTEKHNLNKIGVSDKTVVKAVEASLIYGIVEAFAASTFRMYYNIMYMYDKMSYKPLEKEDLKRIISEVLLRIGAAQVYWVGSTQKTLDALNASFRIKKFTPSKEILNFQNRVLTLHDMKMHDKGEEWMTMTTIRTEYDPAATCPMWRKFLTEVIDDGDSIRVLQEFMGCVFIDRDNISIEAFLMLYGKGGNGKSVIERTLKYVLGQNNCSSSDLSLICTHPRAEYYAAEIDGKLLNFAEDMGDADLAGDKFKPIVSHQPIKVRQIYGKPYEARNMPLFAACVNKIPVTTDSSDGYWRRLLIISLDRQFSEAEQDQTLGMKLRAEASGILNWIMEGRERVLAREGKFTYSAKMEQVKSEARVGGSSVLGFMEDRRYYGYKKRPVNTHSYRKFAKEIIAEYQAYCLENGMKAKNAHNLKEDLCQAGMEYQRVMRIDKLTSSGYMYYIMDDKDNPAEEVKIGVVSGTLPLPF